MARVFLLAKNPRVSSGLVTHVDRFDDLRVPVEGYGDPLEADLTPEQIEHLQRDPWITVTTQKDRADSLAEEAAAKKAEAEALAKAAADAEAQAKADAEWAAEQAKAAEEDAAAAAKAKK